METQPMPLHALVKREGKVKYPGDASTVAKANKVAMAFIVVPKLHLAVSTSTDEALAIRPHIQTQHLRREGTVDYSNWLTVICIPKRNLYTQPHNPFGVALDEGTPSKKTW